MLLAKWISGCFELISWLAFSQYVSTDYVSMPVRSLRCAVVLGFTSSLVRSSRWWGGRAGL